MAKRVALVVGILAVFMVEFHVKAEFPDYGVIQSITADLQRKFRVYMNTETGFETLQEFFKKEAASLKFVDLDGAEILTETIDGLSALMKKKLVALQKSVDWAEEVVEKQHTWNNDLKLGDIDYIDTKTVNLSDPAFEYNDLFKQKVNFENSSVHIPVEIYEGEITILNGLEWTSHLDEQWRRNREADPELLWQYFGSQTGIMRNYPGSKYKGSVPDLYDVRRRPWYTQGASSPKDMLILVDTSGSTQGQALTLMKHATESLIDTLGENDFVNVVHFAAVASPVMPCFDTFVQATYWNKQIIREYVNNLKSKEMASYKAGFEYAFKEFEKFGMAENRTEGTGALCNRIIMLLTDGGTEMPQELFDKYNGDKKIRVFTYAVGPTADPIEAVRWIACNNKGYFDRIPAMGAIRSKVQEYVHTIAKPLVLENIPYSQWSSVYLDAYRYYRTISTGLAESQTRDSLYTDTYADSMGLGMMTTVTLPVYNKTLDASNQTILGVMGSDITVKDMEKFVPVRKIGANGYMFAINSNGYIIFHPDLRTSSGWVKDPANVDFLDIEFDSADKAEVRKAMIDGETGLSTFSSIIYLPDESHIDNKTRIYHYRPVPNSTFSLGLVLPEYAKLYHNGRTTPISVEEAMVILEPEDGSEILVSPDLDYCKNFEKNENLTSTANLVMALGSKNASCDDDLLQELYSDAEVTKQIISDWKTHVDSEMFGIEAFFVSTNSGLTRVFPANYSVLMEDNLDPWSSVYYKRSFDSDHWIYSVPHYAAKMEVNGTEPEALVLVTRAMSLTHQGKTYKPGVVGGWLNQTKMRTIIIEKEPKCGELELYTCYLLDDGGFLVHSTDSEDDLLVGSFFGDKEVEPVLMQRLVDEQVFEQNIKYDYQSACPDTQSQKASSAIRIYIPTIFYDILSVSWWTSKISWSLLNFNLYQWIFMPSSDFVAADEGPPYVLKEPANISCVKQLAQYSFSSGESTEHKDFVVCENCTSSPSSASGFYSWVTRKRIFATSRIKESNLLFVMVEKDCGASICPVEPLIRKPIQVPDPNFKNADSMQCTLPERYRKRPACYDYDPNEDTSICSGTERLSFSSPLLSYLLAISVLACLMSRSPLS